MIRRLLAALTCAMVILLVAHPASASTSAAAFGADPIGATPAETEAGWFVLEATPGTSMERHLQLRNDGSQPIELAIANVDATTSDVGGVTYGDNDAAPARTGAWITPSERTVVVPAGQAVAVPFTVDVPQDAASGDHLAGLAIWDVDAVPEQAQTAAGFGATISVVSRRVIAVEVNVPGAASPALDVTGVTSDARPDGPYVLIEIEGSGQVLTKATGTISIPQASLEQAFAVDTFVPGTAIQYPIKWPTSELPDIADVTVTLDVPGATPVEWTGEVTFGDTMRTQLADRVIDTADGGTAQPRSTGSLTQDALVVLAALILAAGIALAYRRRRHATAPVPADLPSPTRPVAGQHRRHQPRRLFVGRRRPAPRHAAPKRRNPGARRDRRSSARS